VNDFLYQNDHHIVLVNVHRNILAKHHFSKYNKVLLQKKVIQSNFAHFSYITRIYFFVSFSETRDKCTHVHTKNSK